MNNLTQRILTAVVLIPAVLLLTFKAPADWFSAFLLLVVIVSFYEFFKLTKMDKFSQKLTLLVSATFVFTWLGMQGVWFKIPQLFTLTFLIIVCLWWFYNLLLIFKYPKINLKHNKISAFLLLIPLVFLLFLHKDTSLILLLFLIVWGADSFAYFAGKLFGKNKLAPKVSGGKTIEGLIGGLIGSVVLTLIWMFYTQTTNYGFVLLAIITAIFSVVGDLYESIYKREAGVKDSGTILPGHGGILDRIDGLLAATPIFTIGSYFLY